jgi:hypothetical protein
VSLLPVTPVPVLPAPVPAVPPLVAFALPLPLSFAPVVSPSEPLLLPGFPPVVVALPVDSMVEPPPFEDEQPAGRQRSAGRRGPRARVHVDCA